MLSPKIVEREVDKKATCIIKLINHIIDESYNVYKDTEFKDTFCIYHDALILLWESQAREYIKKKGLYDRFVQILP